MKNNIKEIRKARGLTLGQLAEVVCTSQPQIQRLENGTRRLSQDWMEKISQALNCKPEDLIIKNFKIAKTGFVNNQRTGIYPGTFDPITYGHRDVIKRGLKLVDKLIIAVADDIPKTPIFSLKQREDMVREDIATLADAERVEVIPFKGLLVDFAVKQNATLLIRGLRAISDFEYEFQLSATNARLNPDIQTVLIPAGERSQFIASRMVKEIARLNGDLSQFVSAHVAEKLKVFYSK